jgi:fructose 1,6-bisphosphatase
MEETLELIATRVAGSGDTWVLVGGKSKFPSLTETLEAWFQTHKEKIPFRLEPLNGKIFAIRPNESKVKPRFDIYGEH